MPRTYSQYRHRPRAARRGGTYALGALVLVATIVAVAVLVVSERNASSQRPSAVAMTTTTTVPLVAPLTGLPVADPSVLSRPAVNMKIDDDFYAQPQSGVNQADVVYEEVVEGGIDRWMAVFQSQDADPVGPVRSVRQTDADLVAPIRGLFAYSGGIAPFVTDIMATGVKDVGAATGDPAAYTRNPDRQEPDNLYTSTALLRNDALSVNHSLDRPPPPLFDFRALGAPFGAVGATSVGAFTVQMSGETTAGWQWDPSAGVWDRLEGDGGTPELRYAASGNPIAFSNVIVEYVPYHDTGYVDPAGNPVPDADTIGSGEALIFSGGAVARATWSKPNQRAVITYAAANGKPVALEPGNTWIELVPTGQSAPACTGGSGLASPLCLSAVPAGTISSRTTG